MSRPRDDGIAPFSELLDKSLNSIIKYKLKIINSTRIKIWTCNGRQDILQYSKKQKVSNICWYSSLQIICPQVPTLMIKMTPSGVKCTYMNESYQMQEQWIWVRCSFVKLTYKALSSVQFVISFGIDPCKLFWWSALFQGEIELQSEILQEEKQKRVKKGIELTVFAIYEVCQCWEI